MRHLLIASLLLAFGSSSTAFSSTIYTDLLASSGATNGTSLTINDGSTDAIFSIAPVNFGAGTGNLNSFLRLQHPNANLPFEKGYNTDDRSYGPGSNKPEFDQLSDSNFTRSVQIGDLPTVTVGGKEFFELIFDMNENKSGDIDPKISLHELELYIHPTSGSANGYTLLPDGSAGSPSNLGTKVWELDFGTNDNRIELDSTILGSGSGKYDLVVLFETSLFTGFELDDYFYLYNELGDVSAVSGDFPAEATFEEWAYFDNAYTPGDNGGGGGTGTPIPEPSTFILLGGGLIGLAFWRKKRS